jgi:protein-tyrosine-phosphatase
VSDIAKICLKKISSAGVGALVDNPADPSAIQIAEKHGFLLKDTKVFNLHQN